MPGVRVPAQEVVVKDAHLARRIVVANVVEVSLRKRDVERTKAQQDESGDAPGAARS